MSLPLSQTEIKAVSETPAWNLESAQQTADPGVAKRAFLRMVSHELRTPLNSIIGFSEILRQELYGPLGSPQYVEYANIIKDSGSKLLALFNNFIEIVRLEGGGDLKSAPEPVLHALEDAVAKVRPLASARGVRIEIRLLNDELQAMFDPRGLASCLDQLLKNAIDFTADNGTIEVNARPVNDKVDISVFNRGNAPDQGDVERLMKPFEQGDNSVNRSHEGAGLGWAIVRLNAEAMGGAFGVISHRGEALKAIIRLARA
ncbi:HAMP domain-containing sensor histidine kinase [Asticcacaulis sp. 201]|uniref:sensor histidine kinase n=1 Tax=Asticcacaulis sp. 201 TaxID=3028787 RepID=UPI0029170A12|nr:HAMP domain-containing sensor histidine kinase [Asticcacaulis sp. 201]MDV6331878.1 HAMP domain-containing sensor histidine kinase [Asticcacaulis sp. 201]